MKRLSTIIMALAVIMGMTQCTKPAMQLYDGSYTGVTKEITFTTGGSSKVEINNVLNELKFIWKTGDHLYVYGSADGDFTYGKYCGALDLVKGEGTENGFFSGTLDNVPTSGTLRFYYSATELNDTEKIIDLSSQDGSLKGIASHLVAYADVAVKPDGGDYSATLAVPYSVVKVDLSAFGTTDVTMTGTTKQCVTISGNGECTFTAATAPETTISGAGANTYISVIPESGSTTLNFSGNSLVGSKNVTLSENTFQTLNNAGSSIPVPVTASSVSATTNGWCSSSTTAVSFSGKVSVTGTASQNCSFFVVYSSTDSNPTLGGADCTKSSESGPVSIYAGGNRNFTVDVTGLASGETYYYRAYAKYNGFYIAAADVKSIEFGGTPQALPSTWNDGTNPHPFTVASGRTVRFSQGNLQWTSTGSHAVAKTNESMPDGTQGTWRFAEHQFDCVGLDNKNISSTYTGWIDLFGWGTSGYHHKEDATNTNYMPYSNSTAKVDATYNYYGYGPSKAVTPEGPSPSKGNISGSYYDWGVFNDISNDGSLGVGAWRTLTDSEWNYLILSRVNASKLYGEGTVGNCHSGLILLPDDWALPEGLTFVPGMSYWVNYYTYSQWTEMEEAGAVFIPADGDRYANTVNNFNMLTTTWASTYSSTWRAYRTWFDYKDIKPHLDYDRYYGFTVRLVR